MSVLPFSILEMFCSTMSMFTSASATARNNLGGVARVIGDSDDGHPWPHCGRVATPVRMGSSMGMSLIDPVTTVPGLSEYDERTCTGMFVAAGRIPRCEASVPWAPQAGHLEHLLEGDRVQFGGRWGRSAGRR